MRRREFLKTTAAGAAVSPNQLRSTLSAAATDRPNVIVCFTDQFRAFEAGCYGNPVIRTPHIDRLGTSGFRFEVGVTNDPVCSPARANLLSGQHTRTCAGSLRNVDKDVPPKTRTELLKPTLPELFKEAGYQTAHIGKWHLHADPFLLGFDYTFFPAAIAHRYYDRHYWEAHRADGGISTEAGKKSLASEFWPQVVSDKLHAYLRTPKDRPFFVYYCVSLPHMPIGPGNMPDKYVKMYDPEQIPLRKNVWKDGRMAHDDWWFKVYTVWDYFWRNYPERKPDRRGDKLPEGFDLRDLAAYYYGAVTATDDLVGQMMDMLREHDLADNTIVVFSSDHGENLGSHQAFNKNRLIEESIRIPMIYWFPKRWKAGLSRKQVASNIDIMPTLLDACGVEVPSHVQGQSMLPVIEGKSESVARNYTFTETHRGHIGIRTPTHMYGIALSRDYQAVENDKLYFFDLRDDPFELNNLAATDKQSDTAAELRATLLEWNELTPWSKRSDA